MEGIIITLLVIQIICLVLNVTVLILVIKGLMINSKLKKLQSPISHKSYPEIKIATLWDIVIPINELSEESFKKLNEKPYVPRFLTIRNVDAQKVSSLPYLAEFEISERELEYSGYYCTKNKVAIVLRRPISQIIEDLDQSKKLAKGLLQ